MCLADDSHVKSYFYFLQNNKSSACMNRSPAEPGYVLPLQTVDPDQLAFEEAN